MLVSSSRHSSRHEMSEKEKQSESLSDLKRKREKMRSKMNKMESINEEKRKRSTWSDSESEEEVEEKEPVEETITLEELNSIRISRDELERWAYSPFLNKTVIGAYARLGIGFDSNKNYIYRVTRIKDVVEYHRCYKINKTIIKKALILEHGKASKRFGMDIISNGPFTEREFDRYIAVLRNDQIPLPTKDFIKKKEEEIEEARNHKFTGQEIEEMVEEKKRLLKVPKNVAMEKASLILQKEKAEQLGDQEEIANIDNRLSELNAMKDEKTKLVDEKLDNWTRLNERNRKMNAIESRQAELQATHEKKNSDVFDPFARIKCMPIHVVANSSRLHTPEVDAKVDENSSLDGAKNNSEKASGNVPDSAALNGPASSTTIKHFSTALVEGDDFNIDIDVSEVALVI